ncbi:MAG: GNAT family N-acetyltransferase [Maritimibacter sp.]|nr:GNAT family N-acetyltransferase [Maritimibacter sp.]
MTQRAVVIRPARADEFPTLSTLWLAASRGAHGFLGAARLEAQRPLIEQTYLPGSRTHVAEADGVLLGFIGLIGDFVGGLFVAPEAQGQGIGRRLLDHAKARHGRLELEVYTGNPGALRFYLSQGFREISRRPQDSEGLPFETARLAWAPPLTAARTAG